MKIKRIFLLMVVMLAASCGSAYKTSNQQTAAVDSVSFEEYYAPALSTDKIQSTFLGCTFGCSKKVVMNKLEGTLDEKENTYIVKNVSFGGLDWESATFHFSGYDRLYKCCVLREGPEPQQGLQGSRAAI